MLIKHLKLCNLLSFRILDIELRSLNVLIGPNGSGKSNFIEAISLIQAIPRDLTEPIRDGGGVADWIWKGDAFGKVVIESMVAHPAQNRDLRHRLELKRSGQQYEIVVEQIENDFPDPGHPKPFFYYSLQGGRSLVSMGGDRRSLHREDVDPQQSIISQRKDPDNYPEITYMGKAYGRIAIYRDWTFGRYTPPREPQKTDLRNDHLDPACGNLALVLNRLQGKPEVKQRLIDLTRRLISGVTGFHVLIEGGRAQLFFEEGNLFSIPTTRLSDGTLRYICLLAILLDPEPPALVCIDEPELGLHPDCVVEVGELLIEASERMQLIVTTHSEALVDLLGSRVEDVIVCERENNTTSMSRLQKADLDNWLQKYSLGQLWSRGQLGGNRW